jgi:hypothetical protein
MRPNERRVKGKKVGGAIAASACKAKKVPPLTLIVGAMRDGPWGRSYQNDAPR